MAGDLRAAFLAMRRKGNDAFTPECLEYLFHMVYRASFHGKGFRDLPAIEFCRIFRDQAAADFGVFSREALERFGLQTFGDVGRAVFLLADQGCLSIKDSESLQDYEAMGPIRFG